MKTLSKKLLTMLLAVVMLVSVVPFQALATTTDSEPHNMKVKFVDEAGNILAAPVAQNDYIGAEFPLTAEDAQAWLADTNVDLTKWEIPASYQTLYPTQNANGVWVYTVTLTAKEEPTEEPTTPPTTEEPTTPPTTEEPTTPPTTEEPDDEITKITLMNGEEVYSVVELVNGKVPALPASPNKKGHEFVGWYSDPDGYGQKLKKGTSAEDLKADTYYACFKKGDDDGVSDLKVYAKFYVGGKLKDTKLLYTVELEDGDNAFDWLQDNKDTTRKKIFDIVDMDDYEWEDRYYYDFEGKEPLTEQDLEMDGNKSVVVKVYSKHEANVLLYVHRKVSSAAENIYEMGGYVKGDTVSRDAVEAVVKKHYSGKRTIKGLYTDDAWAQLRNGEKPTGANSVEVDSNGTVKIHILLTDATSNSNADPSNPKTGDSIFMTITVMAVSAMALAGAYVFNKKRMVK